MGTSLRPLGLQPPILFWVYLQGVHQLRRFKADRATFGVSVTDVVVVNRAVAWRVGDENAQADGAPPGELYSVFETSGNVLGDVVT